MKNLILTLTILFLLNNICIAQPDKTGNKFALELFKEVYDEQSNTFLSPYSISSALAMTYGGARNDTKQQMSEVLHFDTSIVNTFSNFQKLNQSVSAKNNSDLTISVANAIWKRSDVKIKTDYLELSKKHFNTPINNLTTAGPINDWVKKETHDKIDKIVSDEMINDAVMVLTNAIYFKGNWENQFDEKITDIQPFTNSQKKKSDVRMMHNALNFNYSVDADCQALQLPYKSGMSMTILLPTNKNTLSEFVSKLDERKLNSYLNTKQNVMVIVSLPKFKFETEYSLVSTLSDMGMPNAFSNDADFSGMGNNLKINSIVHKAFVDVNEKGTEAAAATFSHMAGMTSGAHHKENIFNANHPFLFLIRDDTSGTILFMGSISKIENREQSEN